MNQGITAVCGPPSNDHGRCCGFGADGTPCACPCHRSLSPRAEEPQPNHQKIAKLETGGKPCVECGVPKIAVLRAGGGGWSATETYEHKSECPALRCQHGIPWADDCPTCDSDREVEGYD